MKRIISKKMICLIAASLLLSGCSSPGKDAPQSQSSGNAGETQTQSVPGQTDTDVPTKDILAGVPVYAPGPYGKLSLILPGDWVYQPYAAGSENSNSGSYGMWIRPADQETGYIDICYMQMFGVCGTGLKQESMTLAGDTASVGTYDDHSMWDFIAFKGINEGISAQNVMADSWPMKDQEKIMSILDSLKLDPDETEGAFSYFKNDSEVAEIGLTAEGHDVTSSGMTIRFTVWDPGLSAGDLQFSSEFELEKLEGNTWSPVPVIVEGDYAFTQEAHIISKDPDFSGTDCQVNWEWLYGKLSPGDYRIRMNVMDFRGTGDYTEYPVYVYFRNGGETSESQHKAGEWLSPVD